VSEPYEIVPGRPTAPAFLICEHASQTLPMGWTWPDEDLRLVGTHWAYDLGARALTLDLAAALHAPAVLATFTRLLVDPNRPEDSPTLFRTEADGQPVILNDAISGADRERRLGGYYRPFHGAVDAELARTRCPAVLAIHTYTPLYEGQRRHLEIGVLFDREDAVGEAWIEFLRSFGYDCHANEPWSGKAGLIHAAQTHADRHARRALELEVRQDLAEDATFRAVLVPRLVRMLGA
jgi:predicted N-formylglutamate amidohydrolase